MGKKREDRKMSDCALKLYKELYEMCSENEWDMYDIGWRILVEMQSMHYHTYYVDEKVEM